MWMNESECDIWEYSICIQLWEIFSYENIINKNLSHSSFLHYPRQKRLRNMSKEMTQTASLWHTVLCGDFEVRVRHAHLTGMYIPHIHTAFLWKLPWMYLNLTYENIPC